MRKLSAAIIKEDQAHIAWLSAAKALLFIFQMSQVLYFHLLLISNSLVRILLEEFSYQVNFNFLLEEVCLVFMRVSDDEDGWELSNLEFPNQPSLRLSNLTEYKLIFELLWQSLEYGSSRLPLSEEKYLILSGLVLNELLVVLRSDNAHEGLHLRSCEVSNWFPFQLSLILLPFIIVCLLEDHNSRLGVDSEFFAQLFVIFAFYSTDLNDTVHLFCQLSVLILYVLAFLVTSLVEENDPDFLSSVELEYLLKI